MLFLSRKSGDTVFIGDEITVDGQNVQSVKLVAKPETEKTEQREEGWQSQPDKKMSMQRDG